MKKHCQNIVKISAIVCILICFSQKQSFSFDINIQPHGFVEIAAGPRFGDDRTHKEGYNLLENRFQLNFTKYPQKPTLLADLNFKFFFKGELILDGHSEALDGWIRESYLQFSPLNFLDVKAGRQILTWGTGDLLFVNDLFPKDFVSFFIGRDVEYLKMPSDAIKLDVFSEIVNLDVIFIPFFKPDSKIRGERISFYNPFTLSIDGKDSDIYYNKPGNSLRNTEIAARLNRFIKSYEVALYGFWGYYKQPVGVGDYFKSELYYPELNVYGASIRGPVIGGIGSCEIGFYKSREDTSGRDTLVENSSIKYLIGYEQQFKNDLTISFQFYINQMLDHNAYKRSLLKRVHGQDEYHKIITLRITKLLYHQNIELSLFVFYSPTDDDCHIRPRISYNVSDRWKITCGANLFYGQDEHTTFGQLKNNDMSYCRIRYSF